MKNRIFITVALAAIIISCAQKSKQETPVKNESATKKVVKTSFSNSLDIIVKDYLTIKNSLSNDNTNAAANAGKALLETMTKTDMEKVSADKMQTYMDLADSVKAQAEQIGNNGGKIEIQREHFVTLSNDINDLVELFGVNQKLYIDFCPMANDNKGAVWISETEAITNPYFGKAMATCGSIKEEL